jgi:hypothetical protein
MAPSNQIPISNVFGGNPRYVKSETFISIPNLPSGHFGRPPPTYSITICQQPLSARACGFSERDRRVIDPPPILALGIDQPGASPEEISAMLSSSLYMVHCSLWNPWSDEEDNVMQAPGKIPQRRLIGTLVGSHFYGRDNNRREQCFFHFADLSVRTPGTYCLKFDLVVLDAWRMVTRSSLAVSDTVKSNMFTVYNAKDFQGMRPSTELTKCLRAQGCLIPIKRGSAKTNGFRSRGEAGSSQDDEGKRRDGGDGVQGY